jgi:hypothetical protein
MRSPLLLDSCHEAHTTGRERVVQRSARVPVWITDGPTAPLKVFDPQIKHDHAQRHPFPYPVSF